MGVPFQTIQVADQDLNRVQGNISSALNQFVGPFIGGLLMANVAVGTTDTVINHKLGRQPQVWVLCDQQNNSTVYRAAWNATSITLKASASCTVSLWLS